MITLERFLEIQKENLEKYKAFVESHSDYPSEMNGEQWFEDYAAWEQMEMENVG